jgi:hypothetical protein
VFVTSDAIVIYIANTDSVVMTGAAIIIKHIYVELMVKFHRLIVLLNAVNGYFVWIGCCKTDTGNQQARSAKKETQFYTLHNFHLDSPCQSL